MPKYALYPQPTGDDGVHCFVRFGETLLKRPSMKRDGTFEDGISCYSAFNYKGRYMLSLGWRGEATGSAANTLINLIASHFGSQDLAGYLPPGEYPMPAQKKRIFEVTGKVVGTGSDGEPVLEDVEVVRELTIKNGEIVCEEQLKLFGTRQYAQVIQID